MKHFINVIFTFTQNEDIYGFPRWYQKSSILKLSWNDLQTSLIPEKLRRSRRISCIPVSSTEQITSWICIGIWTWQQMYHNPASFHQVQAFHSSPGWQRLKEGAIWTMRFWRKRVWNTKLIQTKPHVLLPRTTKLSVWLRCLQRCKLFYLMSDWCDPVCYSTPLSSLHKQ